jgi:hypothetical protein
MQQADTIQLVPKTSSVFNRIIRLFGSSRNSTPQPDLVLSNIDWHDSDSDSKQPYCGGYKQPISGGYNEAFIVQYWTSYDLR